MKVLSVTIKNCIDNKESRTGALKWQKSLQNHAYSIVDMCSLINNMKLLGIT